MSGLQRTGAGWIIHQKTMGAVAVSIFTILRVRTISFKRFRTIFDAQAIGPAARVIAADPLPDNHSVRQNATKIIFAPLIGFCCLAIGYSLNHHAIESRNYQIALRVISFFFVCPIATDIRPRRLHACITSTVIFGIMAFDGLYMVLSYLAPEGP